MDEIIYNLLLKSRAGVILLGVLRYRLTGFETDTASGQNIFSLPQLQDQPQQQQQRRQQQPVGALVYRARGTLTIPLLTGMQPVPIDGFAFFIQMGPPLLTRMNSAESREVVAFNLVNNQQIGGGFLWGPTNSSFNLLGRRRMLPG